MPKKSLSNMPMEDSVEEFEDLYRENEPLIQRFMFWRTNDEMLAQDLTSSVFEKAWRTRRNFSGGSSKAWVFKIARTTLIDHWRKKQVVVGGDELIDRLESDKISAPEKVDQLLLKEQLQAAVTKLPEDMERVISLRFIERRSTRATAKQLGLSEANVRVIQYRALRKLRGYLK